MPTAVTWLLRLIAVLAIAGFGAPAAAGPFEDALTGLAASGFAERTAAVGLAADSGDPRARAVLEALDGGRLYLRKSDGRLVIAERGAGRDLTLADPATGESLGSAVSRDLRGVPVNNQLRGAIRVAIGRMDIADRDPAKRRAAAEALAGESTPEVSALLREAVGREADPAVRAVMAISLARISLSDPDPARRLEAVRLLHEQPTASVLALVRPLTAVQADGTFAEPDETVRSAATELAIAIERRMLVTDLALNLFQGISLGSVLLLAAVGLAITFGVMGVINMAHGEMIMLGAYTAFVVQELFRAYLPPAVIGAYLVVAIPVAFLVAGLVGVAIERGVIRFLYGRPLETLLATWGISLMLQQVVRSVFGAPNREVANPAWMTGAWEALPGLVLTYNRIAIIVFALAVLVGIAVLLRHTGFGLQMRAVTQNRGMASAMGIRGNRVDALTFGLGSGIAGVAGVALSQVGNVSPNLGQTYIVDSFMVVVFGGVGSLWGVLAGAMSLGVVNKILEPTAGAVLGKILVLVFIILFIQKRPRGLFALKGRAAEA